MFSAHDTHNLLLGSYDHRLVALSVVIAICASYAALDLAGRVTAARGLVRSLWLIGGATAMGLGIWSMHYIGMLAFNLPIPVLYDWPTVLLSLIAAILASAVALFVVSRERMSVWRAAAGSIVMGSGIAAMHYTGMAAMRLAAMCSYNPRLFALSVVLAIVISFVALWLSFLSREESKGSAQRKIISAVVMGAAIPVMHYTGMAAAHFIPIATAPDLSHAVSVGTLGVTGITLVTTIILSLAILTSLFDRRLSAQEQELELAEETFRRAFNVSPEPIVIATIAEARFVNVNEAFVSTTGYPRGEVVGRTAAEVGFWSREDEYQNLAARLDQHGSVRNVEINFRTRSGEGRSALCSAGIIEVSGQKCSLSILRDTTEQKFLEKQLRQAQKMEAVGQLSGGIAHDFNNLLGVIIGYSDMLEEKLPEGHPLHRECSQIKKAGESAASLTRQLLAFSRQQVLETKPLDLNTIVSNVKKMLERLIGEHIDLQTSLDAALGTIRADQGQIEQVIINLAVNARDAMPHGGKLMIETANVEIDEEYARLHPPQTSGSYVLLAVSDTGVGMNAETQARIFEPFFTTKGQGKGTGLGLSTVYGVVRQSDGYIWVYSEPGLGTTFKIYLPRVGQATEDQTGSETPSMHRGTETILLVEDAEGMRALARELLTSAGYRVLEADRPDTAIEIARRHSGPIQLLLTDMVMPGMNGRALAEGVLTIKPNIKTIYMSGYTGFHQSDLVGLEAALLSKPFTKRALLAKVQSVLGPGEPVLD